MGGSRGYITLSTDVVSVQLVLMAVRGGALGGGRLDLCTDVTVLTVQPVLRKQLGGVGRESYWEGGREYVTPLH